MAKSTLSELVRKLKDKGYLAFEKKSGGYPQEADHSHSKASDPQESAAGDGGSDGSGDFQRAGSSGADPDVQNGKKDSDAADQDGRQ